MSAVRPSPSQAPRAESFLQLVFDLLQELPGLVSDRVQLLTLELKRARGALGKMLALGAVALLLALTGWFALWIGIAAVVVGAGLAWGWAIAIVLLLNLGGAWAAVARARRLAEYLALPATVRRLTVPPPAAVPATEPPVRDGPQPSPENPVHADRPRAP